MTKRKLRLVTALCWMCFLTLGSNLDPGPALSSFSCDRERKILTGNHGFISSGNKDYPMDSHCEWLIQAPKESFISISFTKMDTECSYDHVFIYDGNSYTSPLLASFSGNSTLPPVTSTQGFMLILLYSDTNYVRSGFEAEYNVYDCPLNCSHRGVCQNHQCICDIFSEGHACETNLCPNECSNHENKGKCNISDLSPLQCDCKPGYSGMDCSLPDSNKNGGNTWHVISTRNITPRASHSGTYVQQTDSLYIFGGYTFQKVLGDTLMFSFRDNLWEDITPAYSPSPRHGHAAICYHDNIILFGGETENSTLSNELWFFNVSSVQWNLMTPKNQFFPPPITKHSVTLVDIYWLYVIGGSLSDGTFNSKVYRINVRDMNGWEVVDIYGGGEYHRRLVGHSAVYHQQTKTIFVFGGITAEFSHLSKLSNQIHMFHVEKRYWIKIKNEPTRFTPLERAFHTAVVVGDYMIVYGGYTHKHVEEEICYDNQTHLYHLRCHRWIDFPSLKRDFITTSNPIQQGVFSHSMSVRRAHTLVMFGGYSGLMHSHLIAYVLPTAVFSDQPSISICSRHKTADGCTSNLGCGWCSDSNACLERKLSMRCKIFTVETCPGYCSALSDCFSCLIWGQSFIENSISDQPENFRPMHGGCAWCIQDTICHSTDDLSSNCSASISFNGSVSQPRVGGWWGPRSIDAVSLDDCYFKDTPPGLVSIKYRHPINLSQPDEVTYLRQASEEVLFRTESGRYDASGLEENILKFMGFLHPLDAKPLSKRMSQLQFQICSSGSMSTLKLSNDSTSNNLEVVASHSLKSAFFCTEVRRSSSPVFPDMSEGSKYLFECINRVPIYINDTSTALLRWMAGSANFEVINEKHLELYHNGSCSEHNNCLLCLTDSLCGWCESNGHCYPRANYQVSCQKNGKSSYLIVHPDNCSLCSSYIYCEDCTRMSNCEWLVELAICVRRGRFKPAVHTTDKCPLPCSDRSSCVSCLGDPGMCAWCEETQTCFLFSTYTSSYAFGKCRDWVDENRSGIGTNLCRNCSRHSQCSTCIRDLTCGWCSYADHHEGGVCTNGDFSGPFSGSCNLHVKNSSLSNNKKIWSYSVCPDLEECLWGLHDCHDNATCHNTPHSYTCQCNEGFEGDGRHCARACPVQCVHGFCSNAPDYECVCELGWTGQDCSINCGCNNHSTCNISTGVCDKCQDWTEGQFCDKCKPGSFGDATTSVGCRECNCNGHGDGENGYCNATTGTCFCLNNTLGPDCSQCQKGYYGDPRADGACFEECHPRKVITNAVRGRFGSPSMSPESLDCLWIFTVHSVLDMQSLLGPMQSTATYLQVTLHSDINVPCPHNNVYVYDGLPHFVASGHPNILLGAFCGTNLSQPLTATASSGYLTLHYKRDLPSHGFNASYVRLHQSDAKLNCCQERNCTQEGCSGNGKCSSLYNVCLCENGYGGENCSTQLLPHHFSWSTLYSSRYLNISSHLHPVARTGHSLVAMETEHLLLFGGYSSAMGSLNDLFLYNVTHHHWRRILTDYAPLPRHFHAAAFSNGSMYIYGGLGERMVLGDFWELTNQLTWNQLPEISESSSTISLAGATLTPIGDNKLILFGGFSPSYGYFEKVMEFDIVNKQWLLVNCTGAQPIGLYGHTSVYHADTESIYVFGGVAYSYEQVAPSNFLYTFHYPSLQWFRLPPDKKVNKLQTRPLPRYFHVSAIRKNYMIVMGGRGTSSITESSKAFAYAFACNLWVPLHDKAIEMVGEPPDPWVGASAVTANEDVYVFGDGRLMKLSLPSDICLLFSTTQFGCMQQTGCAYCGVYTETGKNHTICFSQDKHSQSQCYNPREQSKFLQAVDCSSDWLEKRDCHQYTTCTDCVATWPAYKEARQVCQWCSTCRSGRCVPQDSSCEDENDCNFTKQVIVDASACPMRSCEATDCDKCAALKACIWTRQVLRSSGYGHHTLNKMPIYNWVCVIKEIHSAPAFPLESMPPLECPGTCTRHPDCTSCLQSHGGEGGWHECVWSEQLQNCMSPTFELLACEDGTCGRVVRGAASMCPVPCWQHFQAAHCLAHAHCGWCAFSGTKVDGRGLCMEGGIMGATGGICRENQVLLNGFNMPSQTLKWFQLSKGPPVWTYLTRPSENECLNGHHNCDQTHEECVDTPDSFECHCKPGYKMKGKVCTPTCQQGCVNGTCIEPDVCQCHFGYVGQNCSTLCRCNGHSNCPGLEELDACLECHNNTFGQFCEKCKPLFVGNPVNGGRCLSCSEYCHTHSDWCFGLDLLNYTSNHIFNQSFLSDLLERTVEGPLEDAVCIDCKNNTEGKTCDQCISGFFKAGERLEDGCRPCECNGHGDTCNPLNGENCNCQNNTENDRQCVQKNMKNMLNMIPCWKLQCSKCTEYFLGSPFKGHQCYRHMYLDKEYCFDPTTQGECNRIPIPLLRGQTVFFAVQPRYMNVEIRIFVDITKGGVDFFLSAKEDTFIVEVEKPTGLHKIYIDEKYGLQSSHHEVSDSPRNDSQDPFLNVTVPFLSLHPKMGDARGLSTYIDVQKHEDFLLVRSLENRLVVTIPQDVHDLRTTRFYMILRGTQEQTFGSLFFRQDQTRIDLFVFFSVFFSCFFLFLAVCVIGWKVKQAFDLRRARRLHAAEMKHMASRPFARIVTVLDDEDTNSDLLFCSPSHYRKKCKYMKHSPKHHEDKVCLRALAVEPLADSVNAVATILVQLPGGSQSLVRMCLGSTLITSRHHHLGYGLRAAMRRRTSHANV